MLLLSTILISLFLLKSLAVVYNDYYLYHINPSNPLFLFFLIFFIIVGPFALMYLLYLLFIFIWKIGYLNIHKVINPGIVVKKDDLPALYNILDELKLATNLKIPINIYTKPSGYAYSYILRDKYKYSYNITLSLQLLMSLNRNEIQAVISYEFAHIIDNNIEILEYIFKLTFFCSRFSFILLPLRLIIKPLIKDLVYINDATAIHITKNPDSLKSALKSIREMNREAHDIAIPDYSANISIENIYFLMNQPISFLEYIANTSITNPYESRKNDLVHPPTTSRIAIINKIKGSSYSLDVYSQAYRNATGKSIKKALTKLPVIAYSPAIYSDNTKLLTGESEFYKAIIRSMKGYIPYNCKCGLKMNIPVEYYKQYYQCLRCNSDVMLY